MNGPRTTVLDFSEPPFLERGLEILRLQREGWLEASNRGNRCLWELLGQIYELANGVHANGAARSDLIHIVGEDSAVKKSNRWHARDKSEFELLIVFVLGLDEGNKGTRSQWHSALRAAQKAAIPPIKAEFVNWIERLGGVEAARKSQVKRSVGEDAQTLASQLDSFVDLSSSSFSLPDRSSDQGFAQGYGLVLVKQVGVGRDAIPVGSVTNERQVTAAMKTFLSARKREARRQVKEYERWVSSEQQSRKARVKKLHREAIRKGRTTAEYDEYLQEWETENLETPEERATRITPA